MENNKIFTKVYGWMFIGLLISFITGYYVSTKPNMVYNLANGYWILALVEIGVCIWLSAGIRKMQTTTAKILFCLYSFLTGLTLSFIFVVFKMESIVLVFGITSLMFAVMALIGHFANVDLTKLGPILFMGLLGIVIASIINIFVGSEAFDLGLTIIGIIIFTVYIAYDIQKVKYIANELEEDKASIICAFELYLDFINLFIKLLRLLGKSKD
ncbi:MAG: Bax inhibitor-1/YccA family protein [Bacilli bacterium]